MRIAEIRDNLEIREWIIAQVELIKEQSSTIVIPDEICCICQTNNVNIQTICLHNFCYICLNEVYHKNNKCPICRHVIETCFEKTL